MKPLLVLSRNAVSELLHCKWLPPVEQLWLPETLKRYGYEKQVFPPSPTLPPSPYVQLFRVPRDTVGLEAQIVEV